MGLPRYPHSLFYKVLMILPFIGHLPLALAPGPTASGATKTQGGTESDWAVSRADTGLRKDLLGKV